MAYIKAHYKTFVPDIFGNCLAIRFLDDFSAFGLETTTRNRPEEENALLSTPVKTKSPDLSTGAVTIFLFRKILFRVNRSDGLQIVSSETLPQQTYRIHYR